MGVDNQNEDNGEVLTTDIDSFLRLVIKLLNEFCEAENVPNSRRPDINPLHFLAWMGERTNLIVGDSIEEYCTSANSTVQAWEFLQVVIAAPYNSVFMKLWYQIVLSYRGIPKNALAAVNVTVLLKWQDGKVAPLSSFVPVELATDSQLFTDGVVCSILPNVSSGLSEMISKHGLDHLHDTQSHDANEEAFDRLMGGILHIVLPELEKSVAAGRLKQHEYEATVNVFRTLQGIFSPPIPPEMRKVIARRRQEKTKPVKPVKPASQTPSKLAGGWEE